MKTYMSGPKLPNLGNEFDSYIETAMDTPGAPLTRFEQLDLEEDADLTLNPLWRDAFLAFMEFSHLPPERLLMYGKALLHAYPPDPDTPGPRYPLTVEVLGRWLQKMYADPELQAYRAECRE